LPRQNDAPEICEMIPTSSPFSGVDERVVDASHRAAIEAVERELLLDVVSSAARLAEAVALTDRFNHGQ
jgi:hypothetical protein